MYPQRWEQAHAREHRVFARCTRIKAYAEHLVGADSARSGENAPAAEGFGRAAPCTNTAAAGTAAEGGEAETGSGEGGAAADVARACAFHGVSGAERD
ncbi:hypothetical protein FGB62_118g025 [Gracilaria domingensis]|nr:hypothetical protein FGB62_118g025 [Gracilaria domingensis]